MFVVIVETTAALSLIGSRVRFLFIVVFVLVFRPHPWRLGVVFPFELVVLEVMLLSGIRPPREAGAALMLPRAPAGVGQQLISDVGPYVNRHRRFGSAEDCRSCAEASTLFSRNRGGERTLVINAKERHCRYKVDQ